MWQTLNRISKVKIAGFTLTEMLTVMLIIGILLSLAIPSKQKIITKAKSIEAKMSLRTLHTSQKTYFYEFSKYASSISELDFEPQKTVDEGGSANYRVEIVAAGGNTYAAKATAIQDFDGDGAFDTWEINQDGKLTNVVPD